MGLVLLLLVACAGAAALLALLVTKASAALQARWQAQSDVRKNVQAWQGPKHRPSSPHKFSAKASPPLTPSPSLPGRQGSFQLSDAVRKYRRELLLDLGYGRGEEPALPQTLQDAQAPASSRKAMLTSPGASMLMSPRGKQERPEISGGGSALAAVGAVLEPMSGYWASFKGFIVEASQWDAVLPTTNQDVRSAEEDSRCLVATGDGSAVGSQGTSSSALALFWSMLSAGAGKRTSVGGPAPAAAQWGEEASAGTAEQAVVLVPGSDPALRGHEGSSDSWSWRSLSGGGLLVPSS